MTSMKPLHIYLSGLVLFCTFGCSNPSNTVVNPGGTTQTNSWVVPTKQTIYIYRIMTQASGSSAITTSADTVHVVDTGLMQFGKTNVVETYDGHATAFYHYESNGDISQTDSNSGASWTIYPSGGGSPISDPVVDSENFLHTHFHVSDVRSYVGKEQSALMGTYYPALHVTEVGAKSAVSSSTVSYDSVVSTTDYEFVPSLGTFGTLHIVYADHSTDNNSGYISDFILVGYYPK